MLAAKNLEKFMQLEADLKGQYQGKIDAKDAEITAANEKLAELQATVAKQLEQITELSAKASAFGEAEKEVKDLTERNEKLSERSSTQKARIKELQKDLEKERDEIKALKKFDAPKLKKNLDTNKKKLAEKQTANDLLQKTANKLKGENAELERKVKELETKLEAEESAEEVEAEKAAA